MKIIMSYKSQPLHHWKKSPGTSGVGYRLYPSSGLHFQKKKYCCISRESKHDPSALKAVT
jgi:hypothetical protein